MTLARACGWLGGALGGAALACAHPDPNRNLAAEYAEELANFGMPVEHKPDAGVSHPDAGAAAAQQLPAGGPGLDTAAPAPAATAEAEVARALDDLHDAAARADEERYFGHFAPSGVFLGTDATERWTVPAFRAYAHPFFARGKAWSFRPVRRAIAVAPGGTVAWFDEDLASANLGPLRGSGVLVREGAAWKVAQYNLAVTVPNASMPAVKRLLEGGAAR